MNQLRIGYLSTIYHTSHILKQRGWLDSLNRPCSWHLFATGPAMVEAFGSGEIDLGYIGLPPAMIGIDRGVPLRCIGGGHVEGTVMIARTSYSAGEDDSSVRQVLAQFAGKKIGSPAAGSIHDVIIRFLLKELRMQDVEVKNYAWADLIPAAIEEGEIDAAVGTPQLATVARQFYGQHAIIPPHCLWHFNPSYGIVIREELIAETELLRGFLQLHEKACTVIREKPEDAAQLLAEKMKVIDRDFIIKTYSISPKYCASLPDEYIESTLAFVPALEQMGYLKHPLAEKDIFDLTLIREVHPEPHHY